MKRVGASIPYFHLLILWIWSFSLSNSNVALDFYFAEDQYTIALIHVSFIVCVFNTLLTTVLVGLTAYCKKEPLYKRPVFWFFILLAYAFVLWIPIDFSPKRYYAFYEFSQDDFFTFQQVLGVIAFLQFGALLWLVFTKKY